MWPTTFGVKTYIIVYGLSILVHALLAWWYGRRMKLRFRIGLVLGLCYAFGMIVGARMLYDILQGHFGWLDYLRIAYYLEGGLWGGPLAYLAVAVPMALMFRRDRGTLLDLVVLTLPVPMILAKLACFYNGCCYGAETSLPWAVAFPEGAVAPAGAFRHPTQLYEIAVLIVILAAFRLLDRRRWHGALLLWFVIIYGLGRPLTEVFRDDVERARSLLRIGPFTASQAACLAAAFVSFLILLAFFPRRVRAASA